MNQREAKHEAELSVLGGLSLNPELIDRVRLLGVDETFFSHDGHRVVFQAMMRLHAEGIPLDMVTVKDRIGKELTDYGGEQFLVGVLESTPNAAHTEYYAQILHDLQSKELLQTQLKSVVQRLDDPATRIQDSRDELRAAVEGTTDDVQGLPAFVNSAIPLDKFLKRDVKPEYLINRVLSKGEEMIIGAPEKTLKTCILADMAISLGSGTPFLGYGQFAVTEPCRVCFMTIETGEAALQSILHRIARSKELHPEDIGEMVKVSQELPVISNNWHMRELKKCIVGEGCKALLLDPAYLTLFDEGSKVQASNLFEMGPLLRRITELRKETGATFVMAHHTRKSQNKQDFSSFRKTTRDDLSQSGFSQWMRQWILLSRRGAYLHDGKHVIHLEIGGSSGHGGEYVLQVDEGKRDNGENQIVTDWLTSVTLARDFEEIARAAKKECGESQNQQTQARRKAKALTAIRDLGAESWHSKTKIRDTAGLSGGEIRDALNELLTDGDVAVNDSKKWKPIVSTSGEPERPDDETGEPLRSSAQG